MLMPEESITYPYPFVCEAPSPLPKSWIYAACERHDDVSLELDIGLDLLLIFMLRITHLTFALFFFQLKSHFSFLAIL